MSEPEPRLSSRYAIDPMAAAAMGTDELRQHFLLDDLFEPGHVSLTYTHYDRMVVGGAVPLATPLALAGDQAARHVELPRTARARRRQYRRPGQRHGRR